MADAALGVSGVPPTRERVWPSRFIREPFWSSPVEKESTSIKTHGGKWPTLFERAAEVASEAAPYMHARLQAIEHMSEVDGPIQQRVIVECV